jgi:hypothetical protein
MKSSNHLFSVVNLSLQRFNPSSMRLLSELNILSNFIDNEIPSYLLNWWHIVPWQCVFLWCRIVDLCMSS